MPPIVKVLVQALIGILLLFVVWAIAATQTSLLVPSPMAALGKAATLLASGEFIAHAGKSLAILVAGFAPAVSIAIAAAPAARESSSFPLQAIVRPLAAMPLIILMPAIIVWMGIGSFGIGVLVFLVTLFPMLDSIMTASRTDAATAGGDAPTTVAAPTTIAAPGRARRAAIPIVAAIRLGLMLGVGAVVMGEMIASREGIGYLLTTYAALFDTAALMATFMLVLIPTALAGMILHAFEDQCAA